MKMIMVSEVNIYSQHLHLHVIPSACRDGAVVRALAFHQCGPGSIPRSGVICGLSLLVLWSAPRGFLWVLRFTLSPQKPAFVLIVNLC